MESLSDGSPRILISGAGIAGPVVAYWLGRAGIHSIIVERASSLRTSGQSLDINGIARNIIAKMGLEKTIRDACTKEQGTQFVDGKEEVWASFVAGDGFTNEIEIVRYELSTIFYEASLSTTKYIFGDSIASLNETDREVTVEFESGRSQAFDVIILADGMGSRARSLVFQPQRTPEDDGDYYFKSLGAHTAFFSVPFFEEDGLWSKWYTTAGRRSIWARPVPSTPHTLISFITTGPKAQQKFVSYRSLGLNAQKQLWRELYQGAGWRTERILDGMDKADDSDFYMQEIAQIRAKRWSKGRVVMVGDAGYCPSPMSGMGTSCAITGSYVLGCELGKRLGSITPFSKEDITAAFEAYENICRPYVDKAADGAIPPFILRIAWPETNFAVKLVRYTIAFVAALVNSRVGKTVFSTVFSLFSGEEPDDVIKLPTYEFA